MAILAFLFSMNASADFVTSEYRGIGKMRDGRGLVTQYEVAINIAPKTTKSWQFTSVTNMSGRIERWSITLSETSSPNFYAIINDASLQQMGEAACIENECQFYVPGGLKAFRVETYSFGQSTLTVSGLQSDDKQKVVWSETLKRVN